MAILQQVGDRQVVGAAGEAVAATLAGPPIHLLPPMARLADQVVALAGKRFHAVANRQLPQPQQAGNRHLLRTGETGLALPAPGVAQSRLAEVLETLQGLFFLGAQGLAGAAERLGQIEIGGLGRADREGADPSRQQKAIGQLQGLPRGAVLAEQGRRILEAPPLVRRRDGHHPQSRLAV